MIRPAPVILLMAASLAAQTPQAAMEARAREIKSLSATVEQRIAVLGMDQTMTGRIRFMAPELLRMDLSLTVGGEKLSTLTVSNGKTLTVFSDMLGVAQSFDLARVRSVHPGWTGDTLAPGHPFQDLEPGSIHDLGEEAVDGLACLKFEGRPRGRLATTRALYELALIRLWLGKADGFPRRAEFLDREGKALLTQTYTGVTLNPLLDPALFMFRPPDGVKVVDATNLILETLGGAPEE